ncbi:MAG: FHA domain-containing protein [Myxococcota bacterium]
MRLEIVHAGHVVHTEPIGPEPISIGRSSSNRIVLRSESVSGHHALLFREGDEIRVRDLRSTNGTYLNGERVTGEVSVRTGDELRFGKELLARISEGVVITASALRLEQLDGPLAWAVDASRFLVPSLDDAILRVGDEEVWLLLEGEERFRIEPDVPFTVGDQRFLLREDTGVGATVRPTEATLPYRLEVDLTEERAQLTDGETSARIRTANRVALLHVLGSVWLEQDAGPGRGWCPDDRLSTLVWGRAHRSNVPNNLNVLIHRVRRDVEAAGLDRWFIERRTGETRIRVAEVVLTEPSSR